MTMIEIIEKKKNREELTEDEIKYWIDNYVSGAIPDYQTSALLMAIRLNGMSVKETFFLTSAMMNSGELLDLSSIPGIKADKHSTGGVGDKTSLVLCPMVASLGLRIAKMSGRGLGFTGGTLDKLESIPGMKTILLEDEFIEQVKTVGMAIISQSAEIDPADKKLYALRDVTGTVDSMPLIASSIMSKKLAAGCDDILLDVKYGSGAFMKTKTEAENLARLMVGIGVHFGKNTMAEITSMNQPLGCAVGNILEVKEAIATLQNKGPEDFTDLCLSSGATMLLQAGLYQDRESAIQALKGTLATGSAYKVFTNFVKAQGGDVRYIVNPALFPKSLYVYPVKSLRTGYIEAINAEEIGLYSMKLGAGREKMDDIIDPAAGIVLAKKVGDEVHKNDLLLTLYTERAGMEQMVGDIINAVTIQDDPVKKPAIVEERISFDRIANDFVIVRPNSPLE